MGGAIDFRGANGTIIGSNFTNNHAYDGGAIYVGSSSGEINVTKSNFRDNQALTSGGAISIDASAVTINESNFYDNQAVNGGALYVGGNGTTDYIFSSIFEGNKANGGVGGAVEVSTSEVRLLKVDSMAVISQTTTLDTKVELLTVIPLQCI